MYATHPSTIAHAQRAMAARKSFVESLPSIDVPTQIIVGQHDVISTREGDELDGREDSSREVLDDQRLWTYATYGEATRVRKGVGRVFEVSFVSLL